jgi:CDGSH-type Zn-finger protein
VTDKPSTDKPSTDKPSTDKPSIQAYTDGPLLVRGEIDILAADGSVVPRNRATVALCRCGVSTIKPFCDGTHKLVNFKTDPPDPAHNS